MADTISRSAGGQQAVNQASTTSTSNAPTIESATSSPQPMSTHDPSSPMTPRGRPTTRYPESLGRVPLHRRGTSKTYERLEDLLREAGYKETRVFTPETERIANSTSEKQGSRATSTVRGGMGAVVGFFAGLVSRNSSLSREIESPEDQSSSGGKGISRVDSQAWSPPPSPLAQTQRPKIPYGSSSVSLSSHSHNASSESLQISRQRSRVDLTLGVNKRSHVPLAGVVQPHQSSRGLPHHPYSHHGHHQGSSKVDRASGAAHAYLRHMASAPNIHPSTKRPSSSSLRTQVYGHTYDRGTQRSRRTFVLNDEDSIAEYDREHVFLNGHDRNQESESRPPLPRNWVEAVAKAILSGGGSIISETASAKTISTRKTSGSALSDHTNQPRRVVMKPPLLCAQVQVQRSKTSEGQVHCTRVTCQSTPTSRASSRVRASVIERSRKGTKKSDHAGRRGERSTVPGNQRAKGKVKDSDIVPSLSRTRAENDEWSPRHRYLGGWGVEATVQKDGLSSEEDDGDEDDDDEDELGLDRLLLPARRQHSIQSLRKHLQLPNSSTSGHVLAPSGSPRTNMFGAGSAVGQPEWPDASWGTTRGRKWLTGSGDGEVEGEGEGYRYPFSSFEAGSTRRFGTKRRQGIPGSWAQS